MNIPTEIVDLIDKYCCSPQVYQLWDGYNRRPIGINKIPIFNIINFINDINYIIGYTNRINFHIVKLTLSEDYIDNNRSDMHSYRDQRSNSYYFSGIYEELEILMSKMTKDNNENDVIAEKFNRLQNKYLHMIRLNENLQIDFHDLDNYLKKIKEEMDT